MQLIEQYKKVVFENYGNFKGRARRSEYWWFFLGNIIISYGLQILAIASEIAVLGIISTIYSLAVLIPGIAAGVRRMHDVGKSGWFLLIPIYNLILAATEGDKGTNEYGDDPKGGVALEEFGQEEILEN